MEASFRISATNVNQFFNLSREICVVTSTSVCAAIFAGIGYLYSHATHKTQSLFIENYSEEFINRFDAIPDQNQEEIHNEQGNLSEEKQNKLSLEEKQNKLKTSILENGNKFIIYGAIFGAAIPTVVMKIQQGFNIPWNAIQTTLYNGARSIKVFCVKQPYLSTAVAGVALGSLILVSPYKKTEVENSSSTNRKLNIRYLVNFFPFLKAKTTSS